ncbi:MAG: FadR/GntR family transcriptional regulator [Eubacteriales bacterium]|nr:FadR/GntR family transcriptional regulator [Eubacteriales bacterium]
MTLHQVTRQSMSEQVLAQMKENIADGTWTPGERLPGEMQLSETFGVSRVTVRNALQKLAGEGLIETRVGDGSYVRRLSISEAMSKVHTPGVLSEEEMRELLEFRCVIEGPLCGLAVSRMTGADVEKLAQCYADMCSAKEDAAAFAAADVAFHRTLAACCQNEILTAAYEMICANLSKAMPDIVRQRGKAAGLKFHKEILEAARAGDAKRAQAAMEEHMEEMARELL